MLDYFRRLFDLFLQVVIASQGSTDPPFWNDTFMNLTEDGSDSFWVIPQEPIILPTISPDSYIPYYERESESQAEFSGPDNATTYPDFLIIFQVIMYGFCVASSVASLAIFCCVKQFRRAGNCRVVQCSITSLCCLLSFAWILSERDGSISYSVDWLCRISPVVTRMPFTVMTLVMLTTIKKNQADQEYPGSVSTILHKYHIPWLAGLALEISNTVFNTLGPSGACIPAILIENSVLAYSFYVIPRSIVLILIVDVIIWKNVMKLYQVYSERKKAMTLVPDVARREGLTRAKFIWRTQAIFYDMMIGWIFLLSKLPIDIVELMDYYSQVFADGSLMHRGNKNYMLAYKLFRTCTFPGFLLYFNADLSIFFCDQDAPRLNTLELAPTTGTSRDSESGTRSQASYRPTHSNTNSNSSQSSSSVFGPRRPQFATISPKPIYRKPTPARKSRHRVNRQRVPTPGVLIEAEDEHPLGCIPQSYSQVFSPADGNKLKPPVDTGYGHCTDKACHFTTCRACFAMAKNEAHTLRPRSSYPLESSRKESEQMKFAKRRPSQPAGSIERSPIPGPSSWSHQDLYDQVVQEYNPSPIESSPTSGFVTAGSCYNHTQEDEDTIRRMSQRPKIPTPEPHPENWAVRFHSLASEETVPSNSPNEIEIVIRNRPPLPLPEFMRGNMIMEEDFPPPQNLQVPMYRTAFESQTRYRSVTPIISSPVEPVYYSRRKQIKFPSVSASPSAPQSAEFDVESAWNLRPESATSASSFWSELWDLSSPSAQISPSSSSGGWREGRDEEEVRITPRRSPARVRVPTPHVRVSRPNFLPLNTQVYEESSYFSFSP